MRARNFVFTVNVIGSSMRVKNGLVAESTRQVYCGVASDEILNWQAEGGRRS